MTTSRLILVRHCEASGQDPGAPLTEIGLRQAHELADFLPSEPVDHIVASAYTRARQSVEPLAAKLRLPIHIDPRLNERILAAQPIANWRDVVRGSFGDPDLRVPGGESAREVLQRGWNCLNDLWNGGHRLPLAVTHGNLMSLVLHAIDPNFGYAGWERLSNPDVYALYATTDGKLGFERLWG